MLILGNTRIHGLVEGLGDEEDSVVDRSPRARFCCPGKKTVLIDASGMQQLEHALVL